MWKSVFIALALVVCALIGLNLANGRDALQFSTPPLTNPYDKQSPYFADREVFLQRLSKSPGVKERFDKMLATRGHLAALPVALRRAAVAIEPELLWRMTNVMLLALPMMSESACASALQLSDIYDENLAKEFASAIEKMPPHQHKVVMDFYFESLQADVDNVNNQTMDVESFSSATATLAGLYPQQRQLFGEALNNPQALSKSQACAAARGLYSGIGRMKPSDGQALIRKLWSPPQ